MTQDAAGRDRASPRSMNNDSPARPPKVAIYDRPASADHRSLSWLAVIVAMVSGVGWLIYWYWTR